MGQRFRKLQLKCVCHFETIEFFKQKIENKSINRQHIVINRVGRYVMIMSCQLMEIYIRIYILFVIHIYTKKMTYEMILLICHVET